MSYCSLIKGVAGQDSYRRSGSRGKQREQQFWWLKTLLLHGKLPIFSIIAFGNIVMLVALALYLRSNYLR